MCSARNPALPRLDVVGLRGRDAAALPFSVWTRAAARRDPDDAAAGTCGGADRRLSRLGAVVLLRSRCRRGCRPARRAWREGRVGRRSRRRPPLARRRRACRAPRRGRARRAHRGRRPAAGVGARALVVRRRAAPRARLASAGRPGGRDREDAGLASLDRPVASIRRGMKTALFLGAGRHQRAAILHAKELGLRVAAIDGNPNALALKDADVAEVVNFVEIPAAIEAARRIRPDGVLTITSDRAVVAVAAVAEALGLPGIGVDVAVGLTHKVEMRRRLVRAAIPQPRFGSARSLDEARQAIERVGFPCVLKPADSGGQRGVFRLESADELEARFAEALAFSRGGETIVEEFVDGTEMNAMAVVRNGEVTQLTLSDRHRPPGSGFAVGWIHAYPAALNGNGTAEAERLVERTVQALGLRNGIAFPQLIAGTDGRILMIEVA